VRGFPHLRRGGPHIFYETPAFKPGSFTIWLQAPDFSPGIYFKSAMAKDYIFPPATRYTCINCGRCCTHWAIKVGDAVAEKLLEYDWGAHYADMKGVEILVRRKTGLAEGDAYFMRMRKGGRCPFLEQNNFCRIHTDLGYDAKPAGCKLFPLSMAEGPRGIHVRASYYCPAVASNEGKALTAQTRWIAQSHRQSGAQPLGETFFLSEGTPIKWPEALLLEGNLLRIVQEAGRTISDRLKLCGALIEALINRSGGDEKSRLGNFLREMEKLSCGPLLDEIGRPAPSPMRGRLALALFLIQDTRPTTAARIMRIPGMLRFLIKLGSLKSHMLGARASLSALWRVEFSVTAESEELLIRYLVQKITGKRYIEGDLAIEGGWALLCAAFKLTELLARLKAACENRDKVSHQDIIAAIGVADLLVVEHTVFFQMDMTRRLLNIVLSQPGMYRNVLDAL